MTADSRFPEVVDESLVGTYPASAKAGGGFVWDAVLEYRVWCCPARGASDEAGGSDYFCAFPTYEDARAFAEKTHGAEAPVALVLQEEYIDEPTPGEDAHVRERRITEWPLDFLMRPRRTQHTIPDFMAPDAPANRLDVLRGLG